MKILILAIVILVASGANGQIIRPLPQIVQNLSNEDYAIWAPWQNRQAARRAEEVLTDTAWNKFTYAKRLVSDSFSRGNTSTRTSSSSTSESDAYTLSGKGWSDRTSSRSATRSGRADTNFDQYGGTVVTSRQVKYRNPSYVGARPVMVYNPWVRAKNSLGAPDWDNLFIPCKDGTLTAQEAFDQILGPQNPEKVFNILFKGYFSSH